MIMRLLMERMFMGTAELYLLAVAVAAVAAVPLLPFGIHALMVPVRLPLLGWIHLFIKCPRYLPTPQLCFSHMEGTD